ncbi:MAG: metalloregulator ArsR/SmtB family transcription factor [Deltaproteobacteria bacterium]|nr:metalloregulator ArsR/SmtB family transcription factor [Deltaproteobacteria bacterium]
MRTYVRVMKAAGDSTRAKIMKILQCRDLCVCEIQSLLKMSQPSVSRHLKLLEVADLVRGDKKGMQTRFRLLEPQETNEYAGAVLAMICTNIQSCSSGAPLEPARPIRAAKPDKSSTGGTKMGNATVVKGEAAPDGAAAFAAKEEKRPSLIDWKSIWKPLSVITGVFLVFFWLPIDNSRFAGAVIESLALAKWYAQEHVLLCLVPAFFIAGAIACFISQAAVMKYLGAGAKKVLAYGVASVSGSILAVCSCTVLPLFAGIWKRGAGLGPAIAFLYSGPAINILAIVLTARVLGLAIGLGRAVGAVVFSVVIGLLMHFFFRKEEQAKAQAAMMMPEPEVERPLWQNVIYFATMVGILIFATWGKPAEPSGLWQAIYSVKWEATGLFAALLGLLLIIWFNVKPFKVVLTAVAVAVLAFLFPHEPLIAFSAGIIGLTAMITTTRGETESWFLSTWEFTKQIMPLLFAGVLAAGLLLGRPGSEGLIPSQWVSGLVGGNSLLANLFASVVGAFMYFATLTEVPILQGLLGAGMGKGPALALLLAGPALSLPNMLVIRSVMGTKKTAVFVSLVIVMATITGIIFGRFFS